MKIERILNIVLAVATIVAIGMMAMMCHNIHNVMSEPPVVELRIDTTWVHDTIRTAGPVVVREEVREVPAAVDTAAILSAYYTERTLSDTFHLRDVATVRITDTLYMNNIVGRQVDYDLATLDVSYEVKYRNCYTQPRMALSLGAQLGREQAAVMVGLRRKRAELLAGYDLRLHAPSVTLKYDLKQWP